MTKKHFVAAAKFIAALNAAGLRGDAQSCLGLILRIQDNPRFDLQKFEKACGFSDCEAANLQTGRKP